MIEGHRVLIHALPGLLRITICGEKNDPFVYEKIMSPRMMRILAINLFQAAEQQDSNVDFTNKI